MTEERVQLIGQRSALLAKMRAIAKDVRGDDPTRRVHLIVSIDRFLQPPGGGLRYVVVTRLVGQELVRFKVDVSSQEAVVGALEKHRSDPIVERLSLARATFPIYPIAQQFAEKIHAYTRPRDAENTRAKDLADMVWFTTRHTFRSKALIEAGLATFGRRGEHAWPPIPPNAAIPPNALTTALRLSLRSLP